MKSVEMFYAYLLSYLVSHFLQEYNILSAY